MTGIITSGLGGLYTVLCDGKTYECRARGSFRHKKFTPLVGDRCEISADEKLGFVITEIAERKSELIRPAVANLDTLIVAFASKSPEPDTLYIDKLISSAIYGGVKPAVVITKADLDEKRAAELEKIYLSAKIPTFRTSSATGENIASLREFILDQKDKTFSVAGASGVGKSTVINAVFPELALKTGAISERIGRGRHTTRAVSLFPLSEFIDGATGFIADTPGFSMLDFVHFDFIEPSKLPQTFPEFEEYLGKCAWRDCTHTKESGCAITEAVKAGKISQSRRESYLKMYEELSKKNFWE